MEASRQASSQSVPLAQQERKGGREVNGAPTCVFHPAVDGGALRGPIWPNPHRMVHHLPALLDALVLGVPQRSAPLNCQRR